MRVINLLNESVLHKKTDLILFLPVGFYFLMLPQQVILRPVMYSAPLKRNCETRIYNNRWTFCGESEDFPLFTHISAGVWDLNSSRTEDGTQHFFFSTQIIV